MGGPSQPSNVMIEKRNEKVEKEGGEQESFHCSTIFMLTTWTNLHPSPAKKNKAGRKKRKPSVGSCLWTEVRHRGGGHFAEHRGINKRQSIAHLMSALGCLSVLTEPFIPAPTATGKDG
ncbi:hypothetical protein SKAU_G00171790 [Synaphobranchus kaupii]|uniref:Uncharacterized protein n=1 Tax=Synaphobranchus kaupii TaxID=118154 RepID=A0A9Q1FL20_SYNKA|nr:hypothetical protein SKAU_G00171790 [Synaphobranchus kaupii]